MARDRARRWRRRNVLTVAGIVVAAAVVVVVTHPDGRSQTPHRLAVAAARVPGPTTSSVHPPLAPRPPLCTASSLRASASRAVTRGHVQFEVLTVETASPGRTCFADSIATVRLYERGGRAQVAKIWGYLSSWHLRVRPQSNLGTGRSPDFHTAIAGSTPTYVVFATSDSRDRGLQPDYLRPACNTASSVTIYPGAIAVGHGTVVRLPGDLRVCGTARILPFLTARPSPAAFTATARTMALR